jgi:hypothetical protein
MLHTHRLAVLYLMGVAALALSLKSPPVSSSHRSAAVHIK